MYECNYLCFNDYTGVIELIGNMTWYITIVNEHYGSIIYALCMMCTKLIKMCQISIYCICEETTDLD